MRILIEDCEYITESIRDVLNGIVPLENNETIKIHYVGYLYNHNLDECVFFLPKVVLDKDGLLFGRYNPDAVIDPERITIDEGLSPEERAFLYNFSVWIYQAVNVYNVKNPSNIIVKKKSLAQIDFSTGDVHATILDHILALIKFAEENKSFLLFTVRNVNRGNNRINWPKTISQKQPLLRKGSAPIYIETINRRKEIDYEEELLTIYFSILEHIQSRYGFKTSINVNFNLIPKSVFEKYLNGYGRTRLMEIKYRYFSDKTLQIWKLCYAFFAMAQKANSSSDTDDFLIASDFDRVFESIIDDLIGQKDAEYPNYLKEQKDGKEIDHIFSYESLIDTSKSIYYIGDSKYYKTGKGVHGSSEYKQYTYAKNVIQANIDLLLKDSHGKTVNDTYIPYRDSKTEGYDVTPNFFISAELSKDFSYLDDEIVHREEKDSMIQHFDNRLFDRDTLLLAHYDLNFLYVLTLYANGNDYSKEVYRNKARNMFREESKKLLNQRYDFYVLELRNKTTSGNTNEVLTNAINKHFRLLNGKIICPKDDPTYTNLILALERPEFSEEGAIKRRNDNSLLLNQIQDEFVIHKGFELGSDIDVFLRHIKAKVK